jgi:hypothetical protein
MADKTTLLRTFNTLYFQFLEELISIFPENIDIKSSKTFFEITKKANPSLLIKIWKTYVSGPYGETLAQGDLDYFINKDYSEDLVNLNNAADILKAIDKLRAPIKELSEENKNHSLDYLQKLNKLSDAYSNM